MLKCFFSEKVNAEVLVCISFFFFFFKNEVCISLYVYDGSEGKLEMAKHILYKKNYSSFFIMYNGNFCEISFTYFWYYPFGTFTYI